MPTHGFSSEATIPTIRAGLFYDKGAREFYVIGSDDAFTLGLRLGKEIIPALDFGMQELEIVNISSSGFQLLPQSFNAEAFDFASNLSSRGTEAHLYFDGTWAVLAKGNTMSSASFPSVLIKGSGDDMGVVFPLTMDKPIVFETPGLRGEGLLHLNGNRFRGKLELLPSDNGGITVVNELGLEEYLYGVLPKEMSVTWHMDALKAQAVASRTYAVNSLSKWQQYGFDVKADIGDQVYGGYDAENVVTNQAVDETRGQLLLYDSKPITSFYHTDSGGITEACSEAFGAEKPYLVPVKDDFSNNSPHSQWEVSISLSTISKRPEIVEKNIGDIEGIVVTKKSPAGRVTEISLIGSTGQMPLTYSQIRSVLSLKSNLFDEIPSQDKGADYVFVGSGFGHGVGMSQWGAKSMAENGYNYVAILQHYYKNVEINNIF